MAGRPIEADVIDPLNAKHLRGDLVVRPFAEFTPSPIASLRANYAKDLHFCAFNSLRDYSSGPETAPAVARDYRDPRSDGGGVGDNIPSKI